MPHLIIEHSANLEAHVDIDVVVAAVHEAALATGTASVDALRTRAARRDRYAVGDRHPDNAFVAVTARLGPGRDRDEQQHFLQALMRALEEALGDARTTTMLSVEYQEIDPDRRINHNHLRPVIAERAAARPQQSEDADGC